MNKRRRAEKIDQAIQLAYDSLASHLRYTHKKASPEGWAFHRKCVGEYAQIILNLSQLY